MDIKTAERVKELLEQITSLSKINQGYGDRNLGAPIEPCFIIKLGGRVYD